ncbi:MAG: FHA domain-containing protein [Myxococcales bacterium]|nr:FHA domain-containing protein [Myxococcales bacterium]
MQVCRNCGWENPEIAAFCTNCGAAVVRVRGRSEVPAAGPRFRALGLQPAVPETQAGLRAAAPSSEPPDEALDAEPAPLDAMEVAPEPPPPPPEVADGPPEPPEPPPTKTLLDFRVPAFVAEMQRGSTDGDADELLETGAPDRARGLVPPRHAQRSAARRQTGPVLIPDEVDSDISVDLPPADTEENLAVRAAQPDPEPAPEPAASSGDTEGYLAVADEDSLEDGFDDFVDPDRPDAAQSGEDEFSGGPLDMAGAELEIEQEELPAEGHEVRIEAPSDSPYDSDDSLDGEVEELSTSDLHTSDLESAESLTSLEEEPAAPSGRLLPPPLPKVSVRFILRPFSQNLSLTRIVPVGNGAVVIGRGEGDVSINEDVYVSPRHARFSVQGDALFVEDLESLNGVWVRVRQDAELGPGDFLLVGQQILRVDAGPSRTNGVASADGTQRLGATGRSRIRLVQLGADGEPFDVYHVPASGCRIGRRLGELVFTDDTYMSGTHALVVPRDQVVVLRDLSSRNGTWVRVRGRRRLDIGDAVMMGRTVWRVGQPIS